MPAKQSLDPVGKALAEMFLNDFEGANLLGVVPRYMSVIRQGGARTLPGSLVAAVEKYLGPGRGAQLEADYAAFRATLTAAVRKKLEDQIRHPAGYDHPGMLG